MENDKSSEQEIDHRALSNDTRAILQALDKNWIWRGIGIGIGMSVWGAVVGLLVFLFLSGR